MSWLKFIPILGSLIDPIGRVGELIAKARLEEADAANEALRIKAQVRITNLEARRDVLVRDPYGPLVRLLFAFPFIIYDGKLILWDKVFALGATDSLSLELAAINTMIIGFYFLQLYGKKKQ